MKSVNYADSKKKNSSNNYSNSRYLGPEDNNNQSTPNYNFVD